VAHETLHRRALGSGAVAELLREARLQLEGEPVLLASGGEVGGVADAHQKSRAPRASATSCRGGPALEHLTQGPRLETDLGHPERGLEVPQPALPLLHVGLEQEDRVPELLAPGTELVRLGLDEGVGVAGPLLGDQRAIRTSPEPAVAGDAPGVEQRGAEIAVLARRAGRLGQGAHAPAEVDAGVPERGGERTGEARHLAAAGVQQEEVPVGARAHLAPSGPPHSDQHRPHQLVGWGEDVPQRTERGIGRSGHQPGGGEPRAAARVEGADAGERLGPVPAHPLPEAPPRRKGRDGRDQRLGADPIGSGWKRVRVGGHGRDGPRPGRIARSAVEGCRVLLGRTRLAGAARAPAGRG
jgi:hypothetical protein